MILESESNLPNVEDRDATPADRQLIEQVLAFIISGKQIVATNLVENLLPHVNSSEARLSISRQVSDISHHIDFYLTVLDSYSPKMNNPADKSRFEVLRLERTSAFSQKTQFCRKWAYSVKELTLLGTQEDRRKFLLNLICFSTCITGLFFYGAYAYIYFLRSKGLFKNLAAGTLGVARDENIHFNFALKTIDIIRKDHPSLFNEHLTEMVVQMIEDAIECEMCFAESVLDGDNLEISIRDMRQYLEFIADQRLVALSMPSRYRVENPFAFINNHA